MPLIASTGKQLILHFNLASCNLLQSFISSRTFCCCSSKLSMQSHVNCEQRQFYFFSFPFCVPFISFSYVTVLARTSLRVVKMSGERGHPSICDLSGKGVSFSPLRNIMLAVCFLCILFSKLMKFPSIPSLLRVFIMNRGMTIF